MNDSPISTRPLHVQLREVLTERIASGIWSFGSAIPNELDLAREFGLSPGTVRKALDWMAEARLIVRQQGRGTFVRDPASEELLSRFGNLHHSDGRAIVDHVELIEMQEEIASAEDAVKLGVPAGEIVLRLRQLRRLKERPYMVERITLPAALFPNLRQEPRAIQGVTELAFANAVLLGDGEETVLVATAPAEIAALLEATPGEPVLVLDRTVRTITGRVAEWRRAWCSPRDLQYRAAVG